MENQIEIACALLTFIYNSELVSYFASQSEVFANSEVQNQGLLIKLIHVFSVKSTMRIEI